MSDDATKSFEVRALEVYDALIACRLERDVALAENQRLREAATDCLLQWAQGRGIPPRLTSEEVALRDALGLDMEIFGDEHRRSLGPFGEALAGDAK